MTDVLDIKKKNDLCLLNTGSPHCVKLVDDIYSYEVLEKERIAQFTYFFKTWS